LADLRLGDAADFVAVRLTRSLVDAGLFCKEKRRGRRLRDEGERLVGVDRDLDRENRILALRSRIELFAEGHDVDPLRSKGRTYRRGRIGLARGDLQLDEPRDFLCHVTPLKAPVLRTGRSPTGLIRVGVVA